MSVSHAISAFHTYILKRRTVGRRETDKSIDGLDDMLLKDALQMQQACGEMGCTHAEQRDAGYASGQYDAQVRVGHEVFVPAALSNGLLLDVLVP
jgi:hypothetical protein